jgi:alpha-ribazole phosphatase
MTAPREILMLRHPKVSVSGICYGHADVPAAFGDADADALFAMLPRLSGVWTSPLSRCLLVASRIAERQNLQLEADERLRELGFGAFEGLTWTDIETRYPEPYARWMGDWQNTPPPGGETLSELSARVHVALSTIALDAPPDAPPLVVTHAGVVRAALRLTENLSWDEALARPIAHLEPLRVRWPVAPSSSMGST